MLLYVLFIGTGQIFQKSDIKRSAETSIRLPEAQNPQLVYPQTSANRNKYKRICQSSVWLRSYHFPGILYTGKFLVEFLHLVFVCVVRFKVNLSIVNI